MNIPCVTKPGNYETMHKRLLYEKNLIAAQSCGPHVFYFQNESNVFFKYGHHLWVYMAASGNGLDYPMYTQYLLWGQN